MTKRDENDEDILTGNDPDEGPEIPWDEELRQWEEDEAYQHTTLKISLFRQPTRGGEREKVWEYVDEIADTHAIGLRFGGGRYSAYGRIIRDGKVIKQIRRHFRLSDTYNEAARQNAAQNAPQVLAGPQQSPFNLESIARGVQIVLPLIAALKEVLSPQDKYGNLADANKLITGVLQESARAQIAFAKEVKQELSRMGTPQTTHTEENPEEFKAYLLDVLREYGPALVEAVGLKLKSAISFVKRDEVFTALASNPKLFERVYNLAVSDPDVTNADKAMIEKVLTKLSQNGIGFNLPVRQPVNGHARQAA